MFCFSTARERKINKTLSNAEHAKSLSVSSLNHVQLPPDQNASTSTSLACVSDSNIAMIHLIRPDVSFIDEQPDSVPSPPPNDNLVNCASSHKYKVQSVPHLDFSGIDSMEPMSSGSQMFAPIASPERSSPIESSFSSPVRYGSEPSSPVPRTRYKLLHQGDVQVCILNHTRTIVSKVLSSEFLRRWETHHIYLQDNHISSKSHSGFLERHIPYSNIQDVYVVNRWDYNNRYCIRLIVPNGSVLLQTNSSFARDQLLHSIMWKKNIHKFKYMLNKPSRPEVILKQVKNLVEFTMMSPVQDESLINIPIGIISNLLSDNELWSVRERREELIMCLSPLLDDTSPSSEMCHFFSEHCQTDPRSPVISSVFTPIVHRILKRNVDFGKIPVMRKFVADFLSAIYSQNNGDCAVADFVKGVHGPGCTCPHPRVLPNLVAVCLAAICLHYERRREILTAETNKIDSLPTQHGQLQCYLTMFLTISELEDWRAGLAQLLQPVPFPDDALADAIFIEGLTPVIDRIGIDRRCYVHSMCLGIRPGKEGWFHIFCPSSAACLDHGALWCHILETLFACCCRRKSFLQGLLKQIGSLLLMALRDKGVAQQLLCLMLEWRIILSEEDEMHIVTTLQSTETGRNCYKELCKRQDHLRELQGKGGPRKLTVPGRATDADVARLLSCGSFGNLECLSLAFTAVTSACAHHLIALPTLRYLNLWATQFGDAGLVLIAEHLDQLQVLNLCETPVTDRGIEALLAMKSLKKLNLNSTKLSLAAFEKLEKELPGLQELDVRYTDAW